MFLGSTPRSGTTLNVQVMLIGNASELKPRCLSVRPRPWTPHTLKWRNWYTRTTKDRVLTDVGSTPTLSTEIPDNRIGEHEGIQKVLPGGKGDWFRKSEVGNTTRFDSATFCCDRGGSTPSTARGGLTRPPTGVSPATGPNKRGCVAGSIDLEVT